MDLGGSVLVMSVFGVVVSWFSVVVSGYGWLWGVFGWLLVVMGGYEWFWAGFWVVWDLVPLIKQDYFL